MSSPTTIALLSKGIKFSAMSLSKKSKIASRFLDQAKYMSFGDTQSLIDYIFLRSNKGKLLFKNIESNLQTKTLEIMNNIKVLHQNCGTFSGQKSNILALVAGTHTQKTLKDFGFTFSHKQYKLAREKAVIGQFDLNPGEKKIPQSKARIPEDVVEKINSILIEQSIPSSKTIVLAQKNGQKIIKEVRMLQDTKKGIYQKLMERFPQTKISLSKFYTLCPRNFQRASKRTDVCNVCVAGNQYKAELDSMARSGNINLFRMATLQRLMAEFRDHL
ncbi:hypothetical protein BB560_004177, partial [Smittium megazygosporum]